MLIFTDVLVTAPDQKTLTGLVSWVANSPLLDTIGSKQSTAIKVSRFMAGRIFCVHEV
jgi:hypothetical protein